MEMCTPVYSECRVACDEDNPCESGLECDLQQGFCFDPSGEPVEVQPCDDGGTCADAGQTCFVWSQCMRQCVGDEDCLVDETCNPETFLCEWNGQGSECGEGQYACWNAEGTNYYCESEGVECQHHGGGIDFGNYRDCSMYPDDCPEPGICMSAMDVPGICGFSCATNSECESAFGFGTCDPAEGVCVDGEGFWLGDLHECRPVADGPAECDPGYSCRMARFCEGGSPGGPQCDNGDVLGQGCSDFGCYNDRVEGIESPAACEEYTAAQGKYYPGSYCDAEMHCLEPGCYCDASGESCEWQGAYGSPGCEDPQPPSGPKDCTFDPGVCDDAAGEQCVEAASFCMQSCGDTSECAATGYECQDGMCIPGPDATGEPPMCDPAEAGQCGDGSECVTQSICVIPCDAATGCPEGNICNDMGHCEPDGSHLSVQLRTLILVTTRRVIF